MKLAGLAFTISVALAQPPHVQNARMETRAVSGPLGAAFRAIVNQQTAPTWVAYSAPLIPGDRSLCCWDSNDGVAYQGCMLEPGAAQFSASGTGTVHLEGPTEFFVFYRIENKQVGKVRTFSPDCNIDAGGLPLIFLTGVNAGESVALLESLIPGADRRLTNAAISAIGMHRDPAADAALDRLVAMSQPEEVRAQAVFWLGNARGAHGLATLSRILKSDPSDRVRERAVSGLAQSKEAGAIPEIVRVAREDASARVRGQALFWLAQTASRQISEEAIRRAIDSDPETQVKKRAVFALTQMKNGDGVPLLIEIARKNPNPAVRKEAMTWLGRSHDPRAIKFFEDVLNAR
ncbi:MAG TPA: HEAT repeat domain-containing protein [Bryobacteraceae bacterium]|nr:HEAT repeat domain-containing protein [Bryobacteraceae bacterium]